MVNKLDAHAKPPARIREVYKEFQKAKPADLERNPRLLQFGETSKPENEHRGLATLPVELRQIFCDLLGAADACDLPEQDMKERKCYEIPEIPGKSTHENAHFLRYIELPLLDKLLHRDLSNPKHQTNIHLHYHFPYPEEHKSFFDSTAKYLQFEPKDPSIHKPLTTAQLLTKKLRWTTLGGQYDWTNKVYPSSAPPSFPSDVKALVERTFPMKAEAAIVNLYSPGDTLSLHRDVSEECNRPLVSISLGCDAIFTCGLDEERVATLRLKSGDAVLMSDESRYAWHGVPKVLEGSCPEWMADWPGEGYEEWKGWMSGKRINLNVRQMFA